LSAKCCRIGPKHERNCCVRLGSRKPCMRGHRNDIHHASLQNMNRTLIASLLVPPALRSSRARDLRFAIDCSR
jgi:hypothetical protein